MDSVTLLVVIIASVPALLIVTGLIQIYNIRYTRGYSKKLDIDLRRMSR